MTAMPISHGARTGSDEDQAAHAMVRPGLIAFAATLVLAVTTGLPMGSAIKLIPQADDRDGPFLGI